MGSLAELVVVQMLRGRGLQQKVLVHKYFHVQTLLNDVINDSRGNAAPGPDSTYLAL